MTTKKELRLQQQEELRESRARETFKIESRKNYTKWAVWGGVGIVGLAAVIFFLLQAGKPQTYDPTQACTQDMYVTFHIHPHLTILVDGQQQTIPQGIGVLSTCFRPLHTHDDTGTIHVESPIKRDFTLGEFFQIWGKPFDSSHILSFIKDDKHNLTMSVNGQPSNDWQNLIFVDKQEIVVSYTAKK